MAAQSNQTKNLIFVHSSLDEAGLDPYEFRLLAHIARRGFCFASLATTAALCDMSVRKAQDALKFLVAEGLVLKQTRKGHSDVYTLPPPTELAARLNSSDQLLKRRMLREEQLSLKKTKKAKQVDPFSSDVYTQPVENAS